MEDKREVSKNVYYDLQVLFGKIIICNAVHGYIDKEDKPSNINCGYLSWWGFM